MIQIPAAFWSWFVSSPPTPVLTYDTIEQAIHARIAATPDLAGIVGDRHYTGAAPKPATGSTTVPYLVLDHLGVIDTILTTGQREINTHLYQATVVAASPHAAQAVIPPWKRAFNPWMSPLLVQDAQVITVRFTDRHDSEAGSVGPDGKPRFQTAIRFVVQINQSAV